MQLESTIDVDRTPQQVWDFFMIPTNLARWDRSVAKVVVTSPAPLGVGFTLDTIAPGKHNSQKEVMVMHTGS